MANSNQKPSAIRDAALRTFYCMGCHSEQPIGDKVKKWAKVGASVRCKSCVHHAETRTGVSRYARASQGLSPYRDDTDIPQGIIDSYNESKELDRGS